MINKLTNFHAFISYFLNVNLINTNIFSILLVISLSLMHRERYICVCIFTYTIEVCLILCSNRKEQYKKQMILHNAELDKGKKEYGRSFSL